MAQHSGSRNDGLGKRKYSLHVTLSAIITISIVLIVSVGAAFMMGIMVGRGQNPENKLPHLTALMPKNPATSKAGGENTTTDESLPKAEIIRPEDLNYASTLKGKPGQPVETPKPKNMQNATEAIFTPLPMHNATAQISQGSAANTADTDGIVVQPKAEKATKIETAPQFDYIFQVATFKESDSVDKLRARLEGEGLRSRMEKDGTLLKVLVLVRGTAERAEEVKQRMHALGLGAPIQRGKTAVKKQ